MKKKYLNFALVFVLVCISPLLLTGCNIFKKAMDRYLSVVPTDQNYKATLTYRNQTSNGDHSKSWSVIRKTASISGETRQVIYVQYAFTDNENHSSDFEKTLMFVNVAENQQTVLSLNNGTWEKHTGSFGDKWSDIYGSYSKPGSFVYEFTEDINGRDFPKSMKNETTDYIEYDFGRDNEVFRISNNPYHVLLYYNFDYQDTHIRKEGTITLGTPNDTIPALSTITEELLSD